MAEPIKLSMDGTLLNWLKNVGDSVKQGEIVAEVEADKATVEVEAPTNGVIAELLFKPGDEIKEGTVIGTVGAAGESAAPAQASGGLTAQPIRPSEPGGDVEGATDAAEKRGESLQRQVAEAAPTTNGHAAALTDDGRVKASPLARNIAAERGINLTQVAGTGPGGRIVKADVENFQPGTAAPAPRGDGITEPAAQPRAAVATQIAGMPVRKAPEGPDVEIIDVSRMRARIAANTVESKQQVPHFYVTTEIDLAPVMKLREQLNAGLEKEGVKISVNDLFVKAAALTLVKFPNLNTHFYGDKLVRHKRINIGIAVALPQGGLINVVAKDADKVSLSTLAQHNKEMIARAREGKVKPDDITGSTFTTSNLGPFDVEHFVAIINPPEAGIIAIGTGKKVPIVQPDGTLGIGERVKVTISVDHRVSDGAEGAQYLQALKQLLENPMRLVV